MLLTGLSEFRLGIMASREDETIDPKQTFLLNSKTGGPKELKISNLSADVEQVYGGDALRRTTGQGTGQVEATINADDIPSAVLHAILGYTRGTDGTWAATTNTQAPYCAFEAMSHDVNGKKVYMGLVKGQFSRGDLNPQTNTEKQNDAQDELKFTALSRADGEVFVEGLEVEGVSQEAMDMKVFGVAVDETGDNIKVEPIKPPLGG